MLPQDPNWPRLRLGPFVVVETRCTLILSLSFRQDTRERQIMSTFVRACLRVPRTSRSATTSCPSSPYRSARAPHWVKMKDPAAPVVKREAEEA
jgi:hypothetical protein